MSLVMKWYLENRVIYVHWPEIVTAEIVAEYASGTLAYLQSSPSPVIHTISNPSAVKKAASLVEIRKLVSVLTQPKMGWSATIGGSNALANMMVQVLSNVVPIRVRLVNDLDDAIKFLNHIDPDLPDLNQFKSTISD